ncbi:ArnT family glycosyltransferase [Pseudarthrobacter equi]|uniref:ArnT family glycosyltransferase n=1 Tax=Pseudarthrobacter equi TaxID=728066 RepID=UPI001E2E726B|nr:glycosyltransferase family 39 protein [Pseudarthrobacter equi]
MTGKLERVVPTFWRRLIWGNNQERTWERPALVFLLIGTSFIYLWALDSNGWANPYYSAAAQAGSQDWKAFFFGSFEGGNLITVDKTPLSIWVMSLSVRLFGLSSWSLLAPQALMGVLSTGFLYGIVRRGFGPRTSLFAAAAYASTPVVVLMSRFNNPEPLMGFLTIVSVWTALKAMESGRLRTFALAGSLLGLAFMAKQVQALLVVPSLAVSVLAFSTGSLFARTRQLLVSATALIVAGGAWLLAVEVIPSSARPYIGGSVTNSAIELSLDYNGLARFVHIPINSEGNRATTKDDVSPHSDGFTRIFNGNFAPEIAWILFAGVVCCLILVVLGRTMNFSLQQRNITAIATTWFLTAFLVLCFMGTMIHTYYTYSLAAPLAVVLAVGFSCLWRVRQRLILRTLGAVLVVSSSYMTIRIMEYGKDWPAWMAPTIMLLGAIAAVFWLLAATRGPIPTMGALVLGAVLLGAPLAADMFTLSTPQHGTNPLSGPTGNDPMSMSRLILAIKDGKPPWAQQTALGAEPSNKVVNLLHNETLQQTWGAATYSAQNAALYQLESLRPVIPLGGWLGTDPAPTLAEFQSLVAQHRIGFFIWQQDLLDRGELSAETISISDWVRENFQEQVIDGVHLYDLRG